MRAGLRKRLLSLEGFCRKLNPKMEFLQKKGLSNQPILFLPPMMKSLQTIHPAIFVLAATIFEVAGDAIIRKCLHDYSGTARVGFFLLGAFLLTLYGTSLNLAPVEFHQVVGLYIATLFVVWQIGNFIAFKTVPTTPILVGGALIVIGGLIVTFWQAQK